MHAGHLQALIDQIETLIHRDVGRGMDAVFQATQGGLWGAASAFAASPAPRIGLITGFFVPGADPPAAETDGPAGAALMARSFARSGLSCRLATDTICQSACRAALDAAGAGRGSDRRRGSGGNGGPAGRSLAPGRDRLGDRHRTLWPGRRWAFFAICAAPISPPMSRRWIGCSAPGHGRRSGSATAATSLAWAASRPLEHVPLGETIGCVVPADFLIAAGVSHWGAYALLAALAVLRPDWSAAMLSGLDPALDQAVIEAMVRDGPAVDGVSLRREATIDALEMTVHRGMMEAVRSVAGR